LSSKNLSHVRKLDVSFELGVVHIDPKNNFTILILGPRLYMSEKRMPNSLIMKRITTTN